MNDLLEYVSATLVILRRRHASRLVADAAVTKHAPARLAIRASIRPAAATPTARADMPPASFRTIRDGGVELVTTWSGDAWRSA